MTAGVDGEVVLTPEAKADLAARVQQNIETFKALVRRVYIPKQGSSGERRGARDSCASRPRLPDGPQARHGADL